MAESDAGSVEATGQPETHGHGIVGALKRVKPGEWILIGIGIVGLVVYFVWYQNNQNSNSGTADALTPAGGTSDPNWPGSSAGGSGGWDQLDADIQALTAAIQKGAATTPGTTTTGTSSSGGSKSGGDNDGGTSPPVGAAASSGSGMDQSGNNQAPVKKVTGTIAKTDETGKVGVPINDIIPGQTAKAPANVTSGSTAATGPTAASKSVGAKFGGTKPPVNVRPS